MLRHYVAPPPSPPAPPPSPPLEAGLVCILSNWNSHPAYNHTLKQSNAVYLARMDKLALENKRRWCEECGYRCLLTSRSQFAASHRSGHFWDKFALLREHLGKPCEVAVWIDMDIVLLEPVAIADSVTDAAPIALSHDFWVPNSGLIILRRSLLAETFLNQTWTARRLPGVESRFPEQDAMIKALSSDQELRGGTTMLAQFVGYPSKTHLKLAGHGINLTDDRYRSNAMAHVTGARHFRENLVLKAIAIEKYIFLADARRAKRRGELQSCNNINVSQMVPLSAWLDIRSKRN